MNVYTEAFDDITKSIRKFDLWIYLGKIDALSKYNRFILGPLWMPLSILIVGISLGTLYSGFIETSDINYIPYLTIGFIVWSTISSFIMEGSQLFISKAAYIQGINVPLFSYVLRFATKNMVVFGMNFLAYLIIAIIYGVSPFPAVFLAIPALVILMINGIWVGLFLGLLTLKFRDIGQILSSLMRLMFFATPIIWHIDSVSGYREKFVMFNPFYYFVEVLRAPLLGNSPNIQVWTVILFITLIGSVISFHLFAFQRKKIAYLV